MSLYRIRSFPGDNPGLEITDTNLLSSRKLFLLVRVAFEHDAIHLDDRLVMDEVKHRSLNNRVRDRTVVKIIVRREQVHETFSLSRGKRNHQNSRTGR